MKPLIIGELKSPAILIIDDSQGQLAWESSLLTSFNRIYIPLEDCVNALHWIQQNQPDLIVLNLEQFTASDRDLIAALKLDWLTRDIPVVAICDRLPCRDSNAMGLSYDFYLKTSHSIGELEELVCSLISTPVCLSYAI